MEKEDNKELDISLNQHVEVFFNQEKVGKIKAEVKDLVYLNSNYLENCVEVFSNYGFVFEGFPGVLVSGTEEEKKVYLGQLVNFFNALKLEIPPDVLIRDLQDFASRKVMM